MTPQAATPAANGTAPHATRLPIDDAARQLGISRATVRRRLRSGGLKGVQVATPHGRKWLVEVPLTTLGLQGDSSAESVTPQGDPKTWSATGPASETGASDGPRTWAGREVEQPDRVRLLQAHVDDLRRQLEDRTREVGQLHTLLAQAHQRLLMGSQVSNLGESGADTNGIQQNGRAHTSSAYERRRWWHRLLWG